MRNSIIKALANGAINLFETNTEDTFVLVIMTNTTKQIIPLLKVESSCLAFINTSSMSDYARISSFVSSIFAEGVFDNMYTYTPVSAPAPEHDHVIKTMIKSGNSPASKQARSLLEAAGYDCSALNKTITTAQKRDYSEVRSAPEMELLYQQNHRLLATMGATIDDAPEDGKALLRGMQAGYNKGGIYTGPTGTGKSILASIIADACGSPLIRYQITEGTTVEDLIGTYVPDNTGSGKNWRFAMGPLLMAATKGLHICLDEVNFGSTAVLSIINQFTDDTPSITIYDDVYPKHPNFVIHLTMNPGYKGTEILNVALKNRFAVINVPALTEGQFCQRLIKHSILRGHELSRAFLSKLYAFAAAVEKEGNSNKWHEDLKFSIRNAQRLIDQILIKPLSFEEFQSAIAVAYLNNLSMDSDNDEKLQQYKIDETIVSDIQMLYNLYDFSETVYVDADVSFEDILAADDESTTTRASSKDKYAAEINDIAARL